MNSFSIGTFEFKLKKIDAFKQFHIVRKIAPILADLLPAMKNIQSATNIENLSESEKLDQFAKIAAPVMDGLSKLSDTDADKVLLDLLSSAEIQRQNVPGWSPVASSVGLHHQDLELPVLLQIAGRAFAFNLSGFFGALPQLSK